MVNSYCAAITLCFAASCGGGPAKDDATKPAATPSATARARVIEATVERAIPPVVQIKGEETFTTLAERMSANGVPGLSIVVFENYEIVWAKAYGVAHKRGRAVDTDTVFQAASISKPVNALAVLLAAAAGSLRIETPVNSQLQSWKIPDNELTKKTPVTLKMLLSHTAGTTVHGFGGYPTGSKLPTTIEILEGRAPANSAPVRVDIPPGSMFRYSGGGTTVSQLALVDNVSGAYAEILQRSVLDPLGMTRSTFAQPLPAEKLRNAAAGHLRSGEPIATQRHVYPEMAAAGLWTTPTDMARFLIAIAAARNGKPSRIPRSIATAMTTPVITEEESGTAVGLGLFLDKRGDEWMFGHGGVNAGFQSIASSSRDRGYGYVIMTNSDNGLELAVEVERALLSLEGWSGNQPMQRVALAPGVKTKIVGRYVLEGSAIPFDLSVQGGTLVLTRPFIEPVEIVATTRGLVHREDGRRLELGAGARSLTIVARNEANRVTATRMPDGAIPPLFLLANGDTDGALSRWKEITQKEPGNPLLDEASLNGFGYELLGREQTADAITLFRFIATVIPGSSNAYDSLGEALAIHGQVDQAIAAYEEALAKLDADTSIPAEQKQRRRAHGERELARLRARK